MSVCTSTRMNVILIATCPSGMATSYLVAERLRPAAQALD